MNECCYRRHGQLMKRLLALFIVVGLFFSDDLLGQKEYNVWYFGMGAGLDFSGGAPVPLTDGRMIAPEGCAVMCDRNTGRVLFYTNGMTVWDGTHAVMENGDGLLGDTNAVQSVLIVPFPCDTNRYYVFTTDCVTCLDRDQSNYGDAIEGNKGLHYSVVDMRPNDGRGAIIEKNVRILPKSTERLAGALHANGRDYWVVTQELVSYNFHAFPVTCVGVGLPVVSEAADYVRPEAWKDRSHDFGAIKISPDGTKLAMSSGAQLVNEFIDLYRFDPWTGRLTDRVHLPHITYGISFSPDGNMLYSQGHGDYGVYQFDLSQWDGAAIAASRIEVGRFGPPGLWEGTLQIGPDGKLYVTTGLDGDTMLSVVENPNGRGAACNFRKRAVPLGGRRTAQGLPNNIDSRPFGRKRTCEPAAGFDVERTTICGRTELNVTDRSTDANGEIHWLFPGGTPSEWSGPDPPPVFYERPGRYVVTQIAIADICTGKLYDTAEVEVLVNPSPMVDAGADIALCTEDSVLLAGSGTGEVLTWRWSPAEGLSCVDCPEPTAKPDRTTSYVLEVTNSFGCTASDTIIVWRGARTIPLRVDVRAGEPGDTVRLPVVLEGTIEGEYVRELQLRLRYDSSMFIPLNIDDDSDSSLIGAALDGWSITSVQIGPSETVITARTSGTAIQLKRGDTLLRLPGTLYLGERPAARIELYVESPDLTCSTIEADTAHVPVNICGLHLRLIEFGAGKYVAPRAVPNPARDRVRIEFGLGLDGPALMEIFDVTGNRVDLLVDGPLKAGTYAIDWDAGSFGAGFYWLRLTSGDWNVAERVIIE